MVGKLQSNTILLSTALLLSSYNHLLPKRIARDRRNPVEFRSLQISPKNIQENSETPEKTTEVEKQNKKEEWRKREVTRADMIDIAAQTALGTGIGYVAGSAVYTANTAITASASSTTAAALTTAAQAAPGVAKALLAVAKAITAAGTVTVSAPVIIGGGMAAGSGLGFYWAWSNWKRG